MRTCLAIVMILPVGIGGVSAELASSATHQLESAGMGGAGVPCSNASYQITNAIVAQTSPLPAPDESVGSAFFSSQPGLIPTLYPRTRLGDSNNDGTLDAADAVTSVQISNSAVPVPTNVTHFFNADANTDGVVDSGDITAVVDAMLGL